MSISVVDIFAGPGGLGEGFSALKDNADNRAFNIISSVEEKNFECQTLRMRSFARKLIDSGHSKHYLKYLASPTEEILKALQQDFPSAWADATSEIIEKSIDEHSQTEIVNLIKSRLLPERPLVLLGGPPCQAYSLVGRARNTKRIKSNDEVWKNDKRRTLYKRYLYFVKELEPDAFVMENVKGMLSATLENKRVFDKVRADLESIAGGYNLYSLVKSDKPEELSASDFIIRSENYGIPQRRHRVIILGVRKDIKKKPRILEPAYDDPTVEECIGDLPQLRSSFSTREKDLSKEASAWIKFVSDILVGYGVAESGSELTLPTGIGGEWVSSRRKPKFLKEWYRPLRMNGIPNHETRSHIAKDIERYIFCALKAEEDGYSPKLGDFPNDLLPKHKNISSIKDKPKDSKRKAVVFSDRFRVQIGDEPSTTITSHISKDGHYYIHYDPKQARSLTVREAARLQTFPDDYRFEGTRTSQYHQVGNAVPPYLAYQIAQIVNELLVE